LTRWGKQVFVRNHCLNVHESGQRASGSERKQCGIHMADSE
jgi:hypothetical protein